MIVRYDFEMWYDFNLKFWNARGNASFNVLYKIWGGKHLYACANYS